MTSAQHVLPTPRELVAQLDRHVHGQDRAKRDLAAAVYKHYLGLSQSGIPGRGFDGYGPQHVLLHGPTGTGKTLLVRTLAKALGVPFACGSAASLVESGYRGYHSDSLIVNLLRAVNFSIERAHRGIIFIDEIDKCRRAQGLDRDVSGEGAQQGLLNLLDGAITAVEADREGTCTVETSRILFICGGAFVGLADIVRKRLTERSSLGFRPSTARCSDAADLSDEDLLDRVEERDLEEYGLIPELIGRFATISRCRALGVGDLVRIMTSTCGAVVQRQQALAALHGIDLVFTAGSTRAIAEKALCCGTGARGLSRTVHDVLRDIDWRLPDLAVGGARRITITRPVVENGAAPDIEFHRPQGLSRLPPVESVRLTALAPVTLETARSSTLTRTGITNTSGWPAAKVRERLAVVKKAIGWSATKKAAREWWSRFEESHQARPQIILRLAEELQARDTTIEDLFGAYLEADTTHILALLCFLDFHQLKERDERRRKEAEATGRQQQLLALEGVRLARTDGRGTNDSDSPDDSDPDDDPESSPVPF